MRRAVVEPLRDPLVEERMEKVDKGKGREEREGDDSGSEKEEDKEELGCDCTIYGYAIKCRECAEECAKKKVELGHYTFHHTATKWCPKAQKNDWKDPNFGLLPCPKADFSVSNPLSGFPTDKFGQCARHRRILSNEDNVSLLPALARALHNKLTLSSDDANGRALRKKAAKLLPKLGQGTERDALRWRETFSNWSEKANFVLWIIKADISKAEAEAGRVPPSPDYLIEEILPPKWLPSYINDQGGGPKKMIWEVITDFWKYCQGDADAKAEAEKQSIGSVDAFWAAVECLKEARFRERFRPHKPLLRPEGEEDSSSSDTVVPSRSGSPAPDASSDPGATGNNQALSATGGSGQGSQSGPSQSQHRTASSQSLQKVAGHKPQPAKTHTGSPPGKAGPVQAGGPNIMQVVESEKTVPAKTASTTKTALEGSSTEPTKSGGGTKPAAEANPRQSAAVKPPVPKETKAVGANPPAPAAPPKPAVRPETNHATPQPPRESQPEKKKGSRKLEGRSDRPESDLTTTKPVGKKQTAGGSNQSGKR
jgi:hypothetical protein